MCDVCRFLNQFKQATQTDVIELRIVAPTVKRLAEVLREVAEVVEQEYPKLDGRSIVGLMQDSVVSFDYEHMRGNDVTEWRNQDEHKTENATDFNATIPFVSGNQRSH